MDEMIKPEVDLMVSNPEFLEISPDPEPESMKDDKKEVNENGIQN
jgi:hypothetical protein